MKISIDPPSLAEYISRQLNMFFPDPEPVSPLDIRPSVNIALARVQRCFSKIRNKYYYEDGDVIFNHLHTDQYAAFLYFVCNSAFKEFGSRQIGNKVYALNKALHGVDIYFEVALPEVFLLSHPVGTVLGRAQYGNYFIAHQQCTVGGNVKLEYPKLGDGVALYGSSAVLGASSIGSNSKISYGAIIMEQNIADNSLVFGKTRHNIIKPNTKSVIEHYFCV
jgi:serine O-acetyltransferase